MGMAETLHATSVQHGDIACDQCVNFISSPPLFSNTA